MMVDSILVEWINEEPYVVSEWPQVMEIPKAIFDHLGEHYCWRKGNLIYFWLKNGEAVYKITGNNLRNATYSVVLQRLEL